MGTSALEAKYTLKPPLLLPFACVACYYKTCGLDGQQRWLTLGRRVACLSKRGACRCRQLCCCRPRVARLEAAPDPEGCWAVPHCTEHAAVVGGGCPAVFPPPKLPGCCSCCCSSSADFLYTIFTTGRRAAATLANATATASTAAAPAGNSAITSGCDSAGNGTTCWSGAPHGKQSFLHTTTGHWQHRLQLHCQLGAMLGGSIDPPASIPADRDRRAASPAAGWLAPAATYASGAATSAEDSTDAWVRLLASRSSRRKKCAYWQHSSATGPAGMHERCDVGCNLHSRLQVCSFTSLTSRPSTRWRWTGYHH